MPFNANAGDANRATQYAYKSLHLYQQEASKHLRSTLHVALAQAMMKMDTEQAQVYLDEVLQQKNEEKDPLVLASVSTHKAEWHFSRQEFAEAEQYARRAHEEAGTLGDCLVAAEALINVMNMVTHSPYLQHSLNLISTNKSPLPFILSLL